MKNLISIIIVNYNGMQYLQRCLESVYSQKNVDFEVVFVDNASTDESVSFIIQHYPDVKQVLNHENLGYAQGSNSGYKVCSGNYIMIMNNDTYFENDIFLETMLHAFDEIPNLGAVQPKIRLMEHPNELDACGSFWTATGFNYHYGIYKDQSLEKYNRPFRVYSLKGVCMLMPRNVIDKVGLFDEDFWCYFEETDFCHRINLAGYENWFYPKATIYHKLGGTRLRKSDVFIQWHSFKNRLHSYLINMTRKELFTILPVYLSMNIGLSMVYLLKGKLDYFLMIYKAIGWNIVNFGKVVRKRNYVQNDVRKCNIVLNAVTINPTIAYYKSFFSTLKNYKDQDVHTCPICNQNAYFDHKGYDILYKVTTKSFDIYRCSSCKASFISPLPTQQELGSFYPTQYYSYIPDDEPRGLFEKIRALVIDCSYYPKKYRFFAKLLVKLVKNKFSGVPLHHVDGGRFLDIGCGYGKYLRILSRYGWECYGVEISDEAVAYAKKSGQNVVRGSLTDAEYESQFFDSVRMWHVFEHLVNPHEVAQEIGRILKPNGELLLAIPNNKNLIYYILKKYWYNLDVPRHVINHNPESIRYIFEKYGFEIVEVKYATMGGVLGSLSNWINEKFDKSILLNNSVLLVLLFYPIEIILDIFKLGDIVFLKLKKVKYDK